MTTSYKNELGRLKADPFVISGIETVEVFINEQPTADVITIPEGATNGDMIKAMFPNELLTSITSTLWWGDNMSFNKDWWNAPYKGESEGTDADSD